MGKTYSVEETLKQMGADVDKMTKEVADKAKQQLQVLAMAAHNMLVQKAQTKLKSLRETYVQNLGVTSEGDSLYIVYLKKPAGWIEEGLPEGEIISRILDGGKPAKVGKNGRYKVIPFEHSKPTSKMSVAQANIANFAKEEIKKRGLNKTVTLNGKPVVGKVATLNITGANSPMSKQGKPLLSGLTIYQRPADKGGKVKKDIFTFRVISESQKGSGLWISKGLKGAKLFEEVRKDLDKAWDEMINDISKDMKVE